MIPKKIRDMPWPEEWHGGMQDFRMIVNFPVVDRERLLVVTFINNGEKKREKWEDFRLICSKKQGAVRVLRKSRKAEQRKSLHDMLYAMGLGFWWSTTYPEIAPEQDKALGKWLGNPKTGNHYLKELDKWTVEAIQGEKIREKIQKGEFLYEDYDLCPDEFPPGLLEYTEGVISQDQHLLYKRGNVRGVCYACRREVRAARGQRFRSHEITHCPRCGTKVICMLEGGQAFSANYVGDVATIQKGKDGKTVFIRLWTIVRDETARFNNLGQWLQEGERYAIRDGKAAKWARVYKERYTMMNSIRVYDNTWQMRNDLTNTVDGAYSFFLPDDWKEIVAGTCLEYIDLEGFRELKNKYSSTIRFLVDWGRYPAVEKLWKADYTGIVNEHLIGNASGMLRLKRSTIQEALQVPLYLLKKKPAAEWTTETLKKMQRAMELLSKGKIRQGEIEMVAQTDVDIDMLEQAMGHAPFWKILRYVATRNCTTYRDYLKECVELGLDLNDEHVLFPKNLNEAHYRTMRGVNYKKNPELCKKFEKQRKKAEKYCFEYNGLMIRPAECQEELILEGKELDHCVGGYATNMANGTTLILMIRRVVEPEKSFYTLEYRDGEIKQCRTRHNKSYVSDPPVAEFVEEWKKFVAKKSRKKKESAA